MRDQLWYCLKDYNGYEYSCDGYLRSMKNYIKNPQGKLIKKYKPKKGEPYYRISNNHNERVKVYESEIRAMIRNKQYTAVRRTNDTDISSRNILEPTKRQKQNNVYVGIPKFTIIKEKKNAVFFF